MLRIAVVGCDASGVPLPVADDHTIRQRIQSVHLTEVSKQLHRRFVRPLRAGSRCGLIRTGKAAAAGILDTGGFAHLHADMGVIAAALGAGSTVPASVVPRKGLVDRAVIGIDEAVDTGIAVRGTVPAVDEHRRPRLRTAH